MRLSVHTGLQRHAGASPLSGILFVCVSMMQIGIYSSFFGGRVDMYGQPWRGSQNYVTFRPEVRM